MWIRCRVSKRPSQVGGDGIGCPVGIDGMVEPKGKARDPTSGGRRQQWPVQKPANPCQVPPIRPLVPIHPPGGSQGALCLKMVGPKKLKYK
jgi:hypothetical protein